MWPQAKTSALLRKVCTDRALTTVPQPRRERGRTAKADCRWRSGRVRLPTDQGGGLSDVVTVGGEDGAVRGGSKGCGHRPRRRLSFGRSARIAHSPPCFNRGGSRRGRRR